MKNLIEKISVTELTVIVICGIGLVMSIIYGRQELSMAISGGLVGYLGGVSTSTTTNTDNGTTNDQSNNVN